MSIDCTTDLFEELYLEVAQYRYVDWVLEDPDRLEEIAAIAVRELGEDNKTAFFLTALARANRSEEDTRVI